MAELNISQKDLAALDAVIGGLETRYGKGCVMTGDTKVEVERMHTGSLGLDIATGGGYGLGRMIELLGPESSGKTTLTIHAMIEAQTKFPHKKVAFIDVEHAFDIKYATGLGLNVADMIMSQPDNGEQALEIAEALISSGLISVCVIDSVAALTPKAEIEGEMGESKMGLHARLMSQACRKLTATVSKTNTVLFWTNQLREKIGVMFGNPETTTGGNALKFYASIRIDIRRKAGEKDKESQMVLHNSVTAKIIKNKLAPPFQQAVFDIVFGEGISKESEILTIGEDIGLLKKSGSWFSYEGTKIGNGRPACKEALKDNPELTAELELKIREHYNIL